MSAAGPSVRERVHDADSQVERIYVWDAVVRITHWTIVFAILTLTVTGIYIGHPFVDPRASAESFIMARMRFAHFYAAIVFTCAVLARVIWLFSGTKYARWDQLLPVTKERWINIRETFLFYTFFHRTAPEYPGHNGLAGATYIVIFSLYIAEIVTGLALYSVDASVTSYMHSFQALLPLVGGTATARWIHHVIMWLLLGFMVHHVFSAILVSQTERDGAIDSIFSGYKFQHRKHDAPKPKGGGDDAA